MAVIWRESLYASTNINDFLNYGKMRSVLACSIYTGGALGDNYCNVGNNGNCTIGIPSALTSFIVTNRMSMNAGSTGGNYYNYLSFVSPAGNAQITLGFDAFLGVITALRGGNSGTVIGTSAVGVIPNGLAWFMCEVQATIDPSAGSLWVRIGGASGKVVLNLTGIDTQGDSGSTQFQLIEWSCTPHPSFYWMHLFVQDTTGSAPWNAPPGDVRVMGSPVTANGTVAFTPVGQSSNYQNVAENPPVPGTDYNSSSTVGAQDLLRTGGIPSGLSTILDAAVTALLAKSDAGSRSMAVVLQSGATTEVGASVGPLVTPQYVTLGNQTDPNTGAAWTVANLGSAEIGYKVTA